jgi:hypothetical protein
MRGTTKLALALSAGLMLPAAAMANEELVKMEKDPALWSQPAGNYANTRYSELAEINQGNVGSLKVGLDLLDRRAARPRGRTAGDRRHHVRPRAVSEHRVRARSQ